jgi:hypothetical protein
VLRLALNAGNDLLLLANTARSAPDVVQPTLDRIEALVAGGKVDAALIDRAVARIGRLTGAGAT